MMLSQIQKRLDALKTETTMQEKDKEITKQPGSKVVAISVDPELYAQLQEAAKKHKVRGVRGALLLAAKAGLRHL
jgi:hypothetical protein